MPDPIRPGDHVRIDRGDVKTLPEGTRRARTLVAGCTGVVERVGGFVDIARVLLDEMSPVDGRTEITLVAVSRLTRIS